MRRFAKGFCFAFHGIAAAVRTERNFRFHLCAGAYVYLFSAFYRFTAAQYCLITALVAGVLALELFNSALERVTDKVSPERSSLAGAAKDMAAGAVLVFCIGAAVCGVLLFWNGEAFARMGAFFVEHWYAAAALAVSRAAAWRFVFCACQGAQHSPAAQEENKTGADPEGR